MKCFVIMPFAKDFDDVYATIKLNVDSALRSNGGECRRLDEQRPAGRITDRLLGALHECSFCIADLTGCSANVMWETGYAMALGKPLIIVTQELGTLPFDVRDMQALAYDRTQLHSSLGVPLQGIIRDTMGAVDSSPISNSGAAQEGQMRLITGLGVQLAELKEMVGEIVHAWSKNSEPLSGTIGPPEELKELEGAWLNESSNSNVYIACVDGHLVAPYCYAGDDRLTAHYYGWQKLGDYFFARFRWISGQASGFTFLRQTSRGVLQGAWWYEDGILELPARPLEGSGKPVLWRRIPKSIPPWASRFFDSVRRGEIPEYR